MPANSVNEHLYRVDKYVVPAAARDEIVSRLSALFSVLREQDGLISSVCLEQVSGPGEFNILTYAEWESQAHVDRANAAVGAHLQETKFDPQETFMRLGVKADLGVYMEFGASSGSMQQPVAMGSFDTSNG